jgi:hypothetical protein
MIFLKIEIFFIAMEQRFPRSPRNPEEFLGDSWIHYCNGYFEVYLFFKLKEYYIVKIFAELL